MRLEPVDSHPGELPIVTSSVLFVYQTIYPSLLETIFLCTNKTLDVNDNEESTDVPSVQNNSDAFSKREKANEDLYMKQKEREK